MAAVVVGMDIVAVGAAQGIPQDIRGTVVHSAQTEACFCVEVMLVLPSGQKAAACVGGGAAAIACTALEGEVAGAVLHKAAPFQGAIFQFILCAHGDNAAPGVGFHTASRFVFRFAAAHGRKDGDAVPAAVGAVPKPCGGFTDKAVACGQDCHARFHAHQGIMGLLLGGKDGLAASGGAIYCVDDIAVLVKREGARAPPGGSHGVAACCHKVGCGKFLCAVPDGSGIQKCHGAAAVQGVYVSEVDIFRADMGAGKVGGGAVRDGEGSRCL